MQSLTFCSTKNSNNKMCKSISLHRIFVHATNTSCICTRILYRMNEVKLIAFVYLFHLAHTRTGLCITSAWLNITLRYPAAFNGSKIYTTTTTTTAYPIHLQPTPNAIGFSYIGFTFIP